VSVAVGADDTGVQDREYHIKAAFLYNLTKFVDWPENKISDPNEPITIGVVGKDLFADAFDSMADKHVKGKKLLIKKFQGLSQLRSQIDSDSDLLHRNIDSWRECHLLFICSSESKDFQEILKSIAGYSVLTVGEIENFIDAGGVVNLVPKQERTIFEVNLVAARREHLRINSDVLRLARRIIKEEPPA
jgi:hypothetical protein